MWQVWALFAACIVAVSVAAQDPVPVDEEYRRSLGEHRRAMEEHRKADAEVQRFSRRLTYTTLVVLVGLVTWYIVAAQRQSAAARRRDQQVALLERRNQAFMALAEAQTARVIALLESIDRKLPDRGSGGPSAPVGPRPLDSVGPV